MGETFLININCSSILFDYKETHYTMFIDTTKISIVYELVEWIRWIFSIELCIYLTSENSVIHELEDIRILSKMKNLELKLCGRPHCVHKKTYRTLLDNLDLFVNWNEIKVHKYFLEKLSQMNRKLQEKIKTNDNLKTGETSLSCSITENENVSNKRISPERSCYNQLSNSNVNNYPFGQKSKLASVGETYMEMNCFDKKRNTEDNLLIHFEDSSDCSNNSSNVVGRSVMLNTKNSNFSPVKSPEKNKLEIKDAKSKNFTKSNLNKTSRKFVRPFSVGEILSNIRGDFEKQNAEDVYKKNTPSDIFTQEGNFEETNISENLHVSKNFGKKRQRIRKRKKPKKQDAENEALILPNFESNFTKNFNILNSNSNLKPNHIRFDVEDEEDVMETDFVEDEVKSVNNFKIDQTINDSDTAFVGAEITKLTDDCQNLPSQPVVIPSESKMEDSTTAGEDKIIDLDDQVCNNNFQAYNVGENFESNSFGQALNMLQSLKEKLKNPVVINRFY